MDRLSVFAICKNESANIRAWVHSWDEVADELVVLDTGSTDDSIEILKEMHQECPKLAIFARTYEESKFDFSDARNRAMSHCRFPWVMWADMDDRIDKNSIIKIRAATFLPADTAYKFQVASQMNEAGDVWNRISQTRLFPNGRATWEGVVHETIEKSLREQRIPLREDMEIIVAHLGYKNEALKKQKALRNIELLSTIENPKAKNYVELGDSLAILGEYACAIAHYESALLCAADRHHDIYEKLITLYVGTGDFENAAKAINRLEKGCSASYFWTAKIMELAGQKEGAISLYKTVLDESRPNDVPSPNRDWMRKKAFEAVCAGV